MLNMVNAVPNIVWEKSWAPRMTCMPALEPMCVHPCKLLTRLTIPAGKKRKPNQPVATVHKQKPDIDYIKKDQQGEKPSAGKANRNGSRASTKSGIQTDGASNNASGGQHQHQDISNGLTGHNFKQGRADGGDDGEENGHSGPFTKPSTGSPFPGDEVEYRTKEEWEQFYAEHEEVVALHFEEMVSEWRSYGEARTVLE
eukprot:1141463-Pelagomonas_calceolata.AAC.4